MFDSPERSMLLVLAFDSDRLDLCMVVLSATDPLMLEEYTLLLEIRDPETEDRLTVLVVKLLV